MTFRSGGLEPSRAFRGSDALLEETPPFCFQGVFPHPVVGACQLPCGVEVVRALRRCPREEVGGGACARRVDPVGVQMIRVLRQGRLEGSRDIE